MWSKLPWRAAVRTASRAAAPSLRATPPPAFKLMSCISAPPPLVRAMGFTTMPTDSSTVPATPDSAEDAVSAAHIDVPSAESKLSWLDEDDNDAPQPITTRLPTPPTAVAASGVLSNGSWGTDQDSATVAAAKSKDGYGQIAYPANASHATLALWFAVSEGDFKMVQNVMNAGDNVDLEATDRHGWSLLHLAAYKGNARVVMFLLQLGIDPDPVTIRGHSPLHTAVLRGHADAVELLLEAGADPSRVPEQGSSPYYMWWAESASTDARIPLQLIKAGADMGPLHMSGASPLTIAVVRQRDSATDPEFSRNGLEPVLLAVLNTEAGRKHALSGFSGTEMKPEGAAPVPKSALKEDEVSTVYPVTLATVLDFPFLLKKLYDLGVDLRATYDGRTLLEYAVMADAPRSLAVILAAGVNPETRASVSAAARIASAGPFAALAPATPLALAARLGHAAAAKALLAAGADADGDERERLRIQNLSPAVAIDPASCITPLIIASSRRGAAGGETVRALLTAGKKPPLSVGVAMRFAAQTGAHDAVDALLTHGCQETLRQRARELMAGAMLGASMPLGKEAPGADADSEPPAHPLLALHKLVSWNPNILRGFADAHGAYAPGCDATTVGNLEVLRYLRLAGANLKLSDGRGGPLHIAVTLGTVDGIGFNAILRECGVSPTLLDLDGHSVADLAAKHGRNSIAAALKTMSIGMAPVNPTIPRRALSAYTPQEYTDAELDAAIARAKAGEVPEGRPSRLTATAAFCAITGEKPEDVAGAPPEFAARVAVARAAERAKKAAEEAERNSLAAKLVHTEIHSARKTDGGGRSASIFQKLRLASATQIRNESIPEAEVVSPGKVQRGRRRAKA